MKKMLLHARADKRTCRECGYPVRTDSNYCRKCVRGDQIWRHIQFIREALRESA